MKLKGFKGYFNNYLLTHKQKFENKVVVDIPAGTGETTKTLLEIGAHVIPFDLFPEYFKLPNLECKRLNVLEGVPLPDQHADVIICQEGIEHFSDQLKVLQEFSRVLKVNGTLIITTPNYSNITSKVSYLLNESERFNRLMPPNELDSIWMSDISVTNEIYYGHIFLIGIQKLRVLAKLSGFKIKRVDFHTLKTTALFLLVFLYPFIFLSNVITYLKCYRKNKDFSAKTKKDVYGEIFKLNINPKILVDGSLCVEFTKEMEVDQIPQNLRSVHKDFSVT